MDNIAKAGQSSLSIISLLVSHAANLFFVLTYTNYVVTEMFQNFKNPATTIPSIEYLQSMVSLSVRLLIQ